MEHYREYVRQVARDLVQPIALALFRDFPSFEIAGIGVDLADNLNPEHAIPESNRRPRRLVELLGRTYIVPVVDFECASSPLNWIHMNVKYEVFPTVQTEEQFEMAVSGAECGWNAGLVYVMYPNWGFESREFEAGWVESILVSGFDGDAWILTTF
jgi:hypothetical protein